MSSPVRRFLDKKIGNEENMDTSAEFFGKRKTTEQLLR